MLPTSHSTPVVLSISYRTNDDKILMMEDWLMNQMGYNRSQLHKQLVRREYLAQRMMCMNIQKEFDRLESTLEFLYSKMELLGENELVQHQMMYLSEEIDITKAKLLDIEMKIFLSTLSNDEEDESID